MNIICRIRRTRYPQMDRTMDADKKRRTREVSADERQMDADKKIRRFHMPSEEAVALARERAIPVAGCVDGRF